MSTAQTEEKKEQEQAERPFPFAFIGVVLLLAAAGWAWIYVAAGSMEAGAQATMLMELSKVLAQVVLVTVLGATVTFVYNQYAKDREQRQAQEQKAREARQAAEQKKQEQRRLRIDEDNRLRRELLASVIAVRAQVERARRRYRLLPEGEKRNGYRATVEEILEARLRISQVWHDSQTTTELYQGREKELYEGLDGMKQYLDQLIDEYEGCAADIQQAGDERAPQRIRELTFFGKFVTGKGGAFYEGIFLAKHYRRVGQIIRRSILDSARQAQALENDAAPS